MRNFFGGIEKKKSLLVRVLQSRKETERSEEGHEARAATKVEGL